MKNVKSRIDALFIAVSEEKAIRCFELLKSNQKLNEEIEIIPRYYIVSRGEKQLDYSSCRIIIAYAEFETEFDKIKKELKQFHQIKNRYLFSEKQEAKEWVKEISDFGFRVFINIEDENTISCFREIIKIAIPQENSGVQDY
jgi:hypothetical protein